MLIMGIQTVILSEGYACVAFNIIIKTWKKFSVFCGLVINSKLVECNIYLWTIVKCQPKQWWGVNFSLATIVYKLQKSPFLLKIPEMKLNRRPTITMQIPPHWFSRKTYWWLKSKITIHNMQQYAIKISILAKNSGDETRQKANCCHASSLSLKWQGTQ